MGGVVGVEHGAKESVEHGEDETSGSGRGGIGERGTREKVLNVGRGISGDGRGAVVTMIVLRGVQGRTIGDVEGGVGARMFVGVLGVLAVVRCGMGG